MIIVQDLYCVRSDLGNLLKALGRLDEAKVMSHAARSISTSVVRDTQTCFINDRNNIFCQLGTNTYFHELFQRHQ